MKTLTTFHKYRLLKINRLHIISTYYFYICSKRLFKVRFIMSTEELLETVLRGEGLEVTELHLVPEQKKPVTRTNTCFAVCAVIFNSKVMSQLLYSANITSKTSYEIILPNNYFLKLDKP